MSNLEELAVLEEARQYYLEVNESFPSHIKSEDEITGFLRKSIKDFTDFQELSSHLRFVVQNGDFNAISSSILLTEECANIKDYFVMRRKRELEEQASAVKLKKYQEYLKSLPPIIATCVQEGYDENSVPTQFVKHIHTNKREFITGLLKENLSQEDQHSILKEFQLFKFGKFSDKLISAILANTNSFSLYATGICFDEVRVIRTLLIFADNYTRLF